MKKLIVRIRNHKLLWWLPLFAAITVVSFTIYLVQQQSLRLGANDVLVANAQSVADDLSSGDNARNYLDSNNSSVVNGSQTIPIERSLYPYIMIFDSEGNYIDGNATLQANAPQFPVGVLVFAKAHASNYVTWEPMIGVRQATVTMYYSGNGGGFVVAGRNLKEVERHIDTTLILTTFGWAMASVLSLLLAVFYIQSVKVQSLKIPETTEKS